MLVVVLESTTDGSVTMDNRLPVTDGLESTIPRLIDCGCGCGCFFLKMLNTDFLAPLPAAGTTALLFPETGSMSLFAFAPPPRFSSSPAIGAARFTSESNISGSGEAVLLCILRSRRVPFGPVCRFWSRFPGRRCNRRKR